MTGQEMEFKAVQGLYDGMLKVSSSLLKLGIKDSDYELVIDDQQFEYLVSLIELTDVHNFKKFYRRIDNDTFTFSCFKVSRVI